MRNLSEIPNEVDYRFIGIKKDGSKIPCIVKKDSFNLHTAIDESTNLHCFAMLKSWLKYERETL
jgi:hypothetical protein